MTILGQGPDIRSVLEAAAGLVRLDLDSGIVRVGDREVREAERRDVIRRLGVMLYEDLHVGNPSPSTSDAAAGRDTEYDAWLAAELAHRVNDERVRLLARTDDEAIVEHLGLRVRVPIAGLSGFGDGVALLPVPILSPSLSPGFALARGPQQPTDGGPMLRLYLGSHAREDATEVFLRVLDVLQERTRWQAKVASQAPLYPRSDAVTVYLHPSELGSLGRLLACAERGAADLAPVSAFLRPLSTGAGCAWEPEGTRGRGTPVSFGQHRARVLARLLVGRADGTAGDDPAEACRRHGIDPDNLWRNLTSPDLELLHRPVQAATAEPALATR